MRSLSAEERRLWAKVTETIRPLSRAPGDEDPAPPPPVRAPEPTHRQRVAAREAVAQSRPSIVDVTGVRHAEQSLDGAWDRKLAQGKLVPDRTIDLHGHRLDDAWEAVDRGIETAIRAGDRLVLLITGHAPKGEPPQTRGRIRAAVHDWLSSSRHAGRIAAVRPAAPRHGGRGALYLVLRRPSRVKP